MTLVHIFYSKINRTFPKQKWVQYINLLPPGLKEKTLRYKRWQDQQRHLIGKLLLRESFKIYDLPSDSLKNITYNTYERPFLKEGIDFNISHSGEYVILAIGQDIRLGVDIEKIVPVDFTHFTSVMTARQWEIIKKSDNPYPMFFMYWTMKESVIKADSRGLSVPLKHLEIQGNRVEYDSQTWYLNKLPIDENYQAFLSTNMHNPFIIYHFLDFFSS